MFIDNQAQGWPERPHLTNSRQIKWERRAATDRAKVAVDIVAQQLEAAEARPRGRSGEDRRRLRCCLGALLMELLLVADEGDDRWLAVSMRQNDYAGANRRYLPSYVSYRFVDAVTRFLAAAGYAEVRRGSFKRFSEFGPEAGRGYRTRFRATGTLLDVMAAHGVGSADASIGEAVELIRLKGPAGAAGGRKSLLEYEDSEATNRWRKSLREWEKVAAAHEILLHPGMTPEGAEGSRNGEDPGELTDPHRARLYRVFNEGRWDLGGRFYGGWWQGLRKADRARITIDGERVVELDFKAMHARLAYHLSGLELGPEVDPYAVPGLPPGVTRDHVKRAFNQLVAVGPTGRPRQPPQVLLKTKGLWPKVLRAIEHHHAPIASEWLRQGRSLELQRVDSEIADKVLRYFTSALKRPVLPIHDSFIVAASDEYKLGEAMMLAYRGALNDRLGLVFWPVVDGWRSLYHRDRVLRKLAVRSTTEQLSRAT